MIQQLWTIQTAAAYLHLTEDTLRRFVREDKIESILIGGRYLIENSSVETFLNNGRGRRLRKSRRAIEKK